MQKYAIICPVIDFLKKNVTARKCHKNWLKIGISWQIKEGKYNDKSIIHLPRQVSLTINHTFVNLGKTGHNMAESLGITTVWTTKARDQN